MRNLLLGVLAIALLVVVSCTASAIAETGDNEGEHHDGTMAEEGHHDGDEDAVEHECLGVYACPMFCEGWMTTDMEAKCPSCNMNIEPVKELYVCPDHPDEFTRDPMSTCLETGAEMVEVEQLYVCPMHPEEIYADPDARCSECGMNLVPIEIDPETCEFHEANGDSDASATVGGCCAGH